MQTITTKTDVYEFIELSDKAKEVALEAVRTDEWYPGEWWSEGVIEDFVAELTLKGWLLDDTGVHLDVSYCQGSGASFDANLDVYEYLKANKMLTKFSLVAKWAKEGQVTGKTHTNSFANHYCHFNTRYFELETDVYYEDLSAVQENKLNAEVEKLQAYIEDEREQLSRDLEKKAYKAYEWYFEDEVIQEHLEANEVQFTIDGKTY